MPEFNLLAIFLTGLLGGVHCVGMCGGIVGAFSLQLPGSGPRLSYHLAANLGRLASYVIAGLIAGALGSTSAFLSQLFPAEKILYVLANLVLIALGLHLAGIWSGVLVLEAAGGGVWKRLQPLFKKLVPIQSVPQAFAAGRRKRLPRCCAASIAIGGSPASRPIGGSPASRPIGGAGHCFQLSDHLAGAKQTVITGKRVCQCS